MLSIWYFLAATPYLWGYLPWTYCIYKHQIYITCFPPIKYVLPYCRVILSPSSTGEPTSCKTILIKVIGIIIFNWNDCFEIFLVTSSSMYFCLFKSSNGLHFTFTVFCCHELLNTFLNWLSLTALYVDRTAAILRNSLPLTPSSGVRLNHSSKSSLLLFYRTKILTNQTNL